MDRSPEANQGVPASPPASPPPGGEETDTNPETLTNKEIEHLARQRPKVFKTPLAEAAFVFSIIFSMTMGEYFISGFIIVLPSVATSLQMPDSDRTWPVAMPNLTTAVLLLPFARLADRHGGRSVFLAGHVWLLVWSLVAGFSSGGPMLIACRALQGLGTAAFLPAGIALLGRTYRPGPRKNIVFSLYGAFAAVGFYFGVVVGAAMGQLVDWRWYFWVGALLVLGNFGVGYLAIPRGEEGGGGDYGRVGMDWWGVGTIVPGLVLVVYALTERGGHAPDGWGRPSVYVTFVLGGLFLCGAVYTQGWVSARPLLPSDLFRPKYMRRLVVSMFCAYGSFGIFLFYSTLYIETVLHATPLQTAAWYTPLAVGGMILALTGGLVLHLVPGRILLIISGLGFLVSNLLFALLSSPPADSQSTAFLYWAYVFPAMLCGTIGVDVTFNATNIFITTSMPARLQATAGALVNSLLYLGMAFWLAVAELAVSSRGGSGGGGLDLRGQYRIGFWVGVGLAGVPVCLSTVINIGQASADLTADEKDALETGGGSGAG